MKNEPEGLFNLKFLQVICQLHEWENQHLEVTSTQAGRYLYLNIARQLQEQRGGSKRFISHESQAMLANWKTPISVTRSGNKSEPMGKTNSRKILKTTRHQQPKITILVLTTPFQLRTFKGKEIKTKDQTISAAVAKLGETQTDKMNKTPYKAKANKVLSQ